MRTALRTALILLLLFGSTALLSSFVVEVGASDVHRWLMASRERPAHVFLAVVGVLAIDSVLAVPTIPTVVVAGYLLGPWWGALGSFTGMMLAGSICYWGGRVVGAARWSQGRTASELGSSVDEVGRVALLLARCAPMMPEVLSAMAGSGRMRARRYYVYFGLGNLPFAVLVAYAGSESTLDRPWPAIVAGLAVPVIGAAFVLRRKLSRGSPVTE
jgi:uncharacterized membrane protein YdjX (TVP38/TMEM64 family)